MKKAVLWSRSRKEPELLAGAGAGIPVSKFRLRLPALGQLQSFGSGSRSAKEVKKNLNSY
jgi:hypothetical protein